MVGDIDVTPERVARVVGVVSAVILVLSMVFVPIPLAIADQSGVAMAQIDNESGPTTGTDNESGGDDGGDDENPLEDADSSDGSETGSESGAGQWNGGLGAGASDAVNYTQDGGDSENESGDDDESDPLGPPDDDSGFGMLSPSDWVLSMLWGVAERVFEEIEASVDILASAPVGLPAPGDISSPSTWANPTNGFWPAVYSAMGWTYFLGIMWQVVQTAMWFGRSPEVRRSQGKRLAISWIMTLGMWIFAPLGLHIFGEAAVEIAPSGEDFMQSPGDFAKFGFGIVLMAILLAVAANVVAIGLIVMFLIYIIAHLTVLFWPLMWPAWASEGQAQSYGAMGIYLHGAVMVIGIIQAIILLMLFNIDFTTSPLGPLGALVAMTAGLLAALVYIPYSVLKNAHGGAAVLLGTGAAMTAGEVMKGAPDQARNYKMSYEEEYHGNIEPRPGFAMDAPQREVGGVGDTVMSGGEPTRERTGRTYEPRGMDATTWTNDEQDRIDRMYG